MADTLNASKRQQLGTANTRRLRKSGQVPAVLYGHGQANVNLAIPVGELNAALRHGTQLVDVRGAVNDSALIREVHWDALGTEVLHIDLTRVSADELVEVTVSVELRGEAPGTKEGGILEHVTHDIDIECPAGAIPDKLQVSINELHIGQEITVSQLELPPKVKLISDPEAVVVQCVEPKAEVEEQEAVPGAEGVEPEVIGRKEGEEEGDAGD